MELTMTEINIALENIELTKNKIIQLLEQLIIDYQNCSQEREKIAVEFPLGEDEFSLLEEMELLTTDIRGYASQIKAQGYINNRLNALKNLQQKRIFNIPIISRFYFNNELNFTLTKNYLRMLDYLRLLILEYLNTESSTSKK
jgi:hypothetical protein